MKVEGEEGTYFWKVSICESIGEDAGSGVVAAVPMESRLGSVRGRKASLFVDKDIELVGLECSDENTPELLFPEGSRLTFMPVTSSIARAE